MKTVLIALAWCSLVAAAAPAAHADVWACKDREGVVRFADRKLRGMRCVLYAKTPAAPKPDDLAGGNDGDVGAERDADAHDTPRPRNNGAAFDRPRPNARVAAIPTAPNDGTRLRFTGDEPDDQDAREQLYAPYVEEASRLYDIPEAFIRAVIRVESNYRYRATSNAGARGLMQLMPSVLHDMGVDDPWDPRANVLGGTRLLRVLADRFDGDIVKVLAAYHAGGGAVADAEGIPFEATESYVRAVLDRYYEYKSRAP